MKDFYKKESPLQGISGLAGGATGLRMAGVAALPPKYVDEVFSTYLYDGNSTARSITNNIDLTKGGLVWTKRRSGSGNHMWYDTERGATKYIKSNQSNAANYDSNTLTSFNSDGFSLGTDSSSNDSGTFGSWTFRKREKFFDIVTYTGNNSGQTSQRNINHNLGSTPGMYMIKDLSEASDWKVYHRGMGSAFMNALTLNDTAAMTSAEGWWHYTSPNADRFVVGNADEVNKEGNSFICYLFAHHDGDGVFGPNEDQDIIHCDYYTGNDNSDGPDINLGWEPQWVLIKDSQSTSNWMLHDSMRGWVDVSSGNFDARLFANTTGSESAFYTSKPSSTGFKITTTLGDYNENGNRYIYMAIRRPDGVVGKPASAGTDVFAMDMGSGSSTIPNYDSGFPVDFAIYSQPASTDTRWTTARLIGPNEVKANDTNAEASYAANTWDSNVGWNQNGNSSHQSWMWKRGQGFDVVTFKGNGSARTINHSLGQTPLMYWVKRRDITSDWRVYHFGLNGGTTPQNYNVKLQSTAVESSSSYYWNNTAPTSTVFSVGTNGAVNGSGGDIMAFLFANANDADGNAISKVGYYTGDNTDNGSYHITTGFQPRFILIKSVSHAENWNVLDSNRGMGTGSDEKVLILNTTAAQTTTEAVDISSTGFSLRSAGGDFNANGYEYIYYAHA